MSTAETFDPEFSKWIPVDFIYVLQICRLRSELDVVRGNTKVMSEMLTEMVPGQEDSSDYELLQVNMKCPVCLYIHTLV